MLPEWIEAASPGRCCARAAAAPSIIVVELQPLSELFRREGECGKFRAELVRSLDLGPMQGHVMDDVC